MTAQAIRDTINSYTADAAADCETMDARMHEVHSTLCEMRPILHAALMETKGPLRASPFADLAKLEALLTFALSAWEPEPDDKPF